METRVTAEQVADFRAKCDPQYRKVLGYNDIRQMILCDRQRNDDIANGRSYYDYETQEWRN